MGVVFYDDAVARTFEPFALTRPISSLVSGMLPTFERWRMIAGTSEVRSVAAPHLADFDEDPRAADATLPAGTVLVNSRFAPSVGFSAPPSTGVATWRSDGRVVASRLAKDLRAGDLADGSFSLDSLATAGEAGELKGWWHDEVWDYLRHLPAILAADITAPLEHHNPALRARFEPPAHSTLPGGEAVLVHTDARIEPHVVFDSSGGPIFVDAGAIIHAFTRINGPCYIGRHATIMGGDISGCSIGPVSKIRGEISSSIVLGYSNKGHDGFVGHSYLGRWVNLGAGTVTSNLKNTYGEVSLWTPTGIRPTGMQFLGTLFGDHVKTGIGTKLTTGTVLGAGANVYGSQMPPKAVAPFSWGDGEPYDLYRIDKFLACARTVMGRRKMELTDRMARELTQSFEHRWSVK
jgi:UDP-N-acetylglucosamine diphosphorylase/glucosamine-1-phosphate N-acetyltransferase